MIKVMTFHGTVTDGIEFYATVAGEGLAHRYFYETGDDGSDRFFYGGNELIIMKDGIRHKGNGGSFCNYMFGVDQPLKDLVRKDVRNRLVMYGATFDETAEKGLNLHFTKDTDGRLSYDRIFVDGNAVSDYYFFLDVDLKGGIMKKQEDTLKLIGKTLKYTPAVGKGDDKALIYELMADLDGHKPVIFLFRLVNSYCKRYYDLYEELYEENREIGPEGDRLLDSLAAEFKMDQYQQERIKIDVIYNNPDNKRVVDEYKDILISFEDKDEVDPTDIASLNRLRSLAIKNNIPHFLFDLLDDVLLKNKKLIHGDEPTYIKDTRALLKGLFVMEGGLDAVMSKDDIVELLKYKKDATDNMDQSFEEILLDAGKNCDELSREGDVTALERFSELVTYFDRLDTTFSMINGIAFMNMDVTVERLRSLHGSKKAFIELGVTLFDELFINDLLANKYLTFSGRRKINALKKGLDEVEEGYRSLKEVADEISRINGEDKSFMLLYKTAKERLKEIPGAMDGEGIEERFLKEVLKGLLRDSPVEKITKSTMLKVFTALKMEVFYLIEVLPKIIEKGDMAMREDFLHNSGFDRFFIEDVEREYVERAGLPPETVKAFRDRVEAVS